MTGTEEIKNWLSQHYKASVTFNEPMSSHTTFKTGGPAEMFISPLTIDDAINILNRASKNRIPVMIIGGGSNLIVKDKGIKGLVVSLTKTVRKISAEKTEKQDVLVNVDSGVKTHDLCRYAVKNGLSGMNFALGIPGTVGGSICMNAGTATGEMRDALDSVEILNGSGKLKTIKKEKLHFSYRRLNWKNISPDPVIFSATFLLKKGDKDKIAAEADTLIKTRNNNQPVSLPSAGCIFKNPDPENPAGKLIDLAGLKGRSSGNAQISERHANFIVNKGGASSSDILDLITLAQKEVYNRFNIKLETEVKIVG